MKSRTIDIHTHILTEAMIAALQREVPKIAPHMKSIDADSALLEVAGTPYRPFPRGGLGLGAAVHRDGRSRGRRAGALGCAADLSL